MKNPFFLLLPIWAQLPMVLLATLATVIASQSVISGAFSMTRQAVQLGFLPRLTIRQTSDTGRPDLRTGDERRSVRTVMTMVIAFGSSAALASAYGVAVTGTFILNTILFLAVARLSWHRSKRLIALGGVVFLSVELTFFAANLTKIVHGGWVPLAIAAVVFTILMTWRKGHDIVTANRSREEGPLREFVEQLKVRDSPLCACPAPLCSSTPTPRRRHWLCAPMSSTTTSCTRTS